MRDRLSYLVLPCPTVSHPRRLRPTRLQAATEREQQRAQSLADERATLHRDMAAVREELLETKSAESFAERWRRCPVAFELPETGAAHKEKLESTELLLATTCARLALLGIYWHDGRGY